MLISHNWLQSHFEIELPSAEKIAETLMMHSFELEGINQVGNDHIIDIDVLPNRAHDCLSYAGVAREYSVLTGYELKNERYHYHDSVKHDESTIPVVIANSDQCYRYMARKISNVVIEDSPKWIKERMESIGQRSINNIVDATNYVMFDTGNPMHAFDADKIVGGITIRNAVLGESMTTLTGEELELIESDLVIADDEGVLALAGVKGGTKAEVTKDTKNIVLEVANFNATTTRTTSRRVKILTDSSKRFENEISSDIAPIAMEAISRLVSDIMKTESLGTVTDVYPNPENKFVVLVNHDHINRLLGMSLETHEVEEIFSKMDYQYHLEDLVYKVHIPQNRLDLRIAEDIIEEIGRIYGYHNIPTKGLEEYSFSPQINSTVYIENKLKQMLLDLGFNELKNYTFVKKGHIQLSNPLASDKSALRKNLHKEMLNSLEKNSNNIDFFGMDRIALFEIGRVYGKEAESDICCIAISNKDKRANKKYGTERVQLEAIIDDINKEFNTTVLPVYEGNSVSFDISGCDAEGSYSGLFDVPSYADTATFHNVSAFPYMTRDVSFWAPGEISESDLVDIINTSNTNHLKKIFVFDRFEKEGRASYGFSLVFQSDEKTLTDEEVGADMFLIEKNLTDNNCEIR